MLAIPSISGRNAPMIHSRCKLCTHLLLSKHSRGEKIEQQVCDRDPVVTRCKHYFCETCALRHNSLNKGKCAICEQPTNGIFNVANDILKKFKEQQRKEAEAKADED